MAELTDDERRQWDVDPDLWPHTPPFHVFAALYDEDDNLWWRAGSGHGLNAYDAAREQVDELTERLTVVKALHQPRPYDVISDGVHFNQTEYPDLCTGCFRTPWPCATARALHPDTPP